MSTNVHTENLLHNLPKEIYIVLLLCKFFLLKIYPLAAVIGMVPVLVTFPLPVSGPYFQLLSPKLALFSFNWVYKLRSSMVVYILVLKVLKKRALIKSLKLGKSYNLINSKNFNTGMSKYLQKLQKRVGYNLKYIANHWYISYNHVKFQLWTPSKYWVMSWCR